MRFWRSLVALIVLALASSAQIDPSTAFLEKTGWDAITAGQAHLAADAFRKGLTADPKNARLHFGAGTAAFLERRDSDAKDALGRALVLDPKLTPARALLGRVLHRMGDVPSAVRTYEALVVDAPDDKEAAATLDRWRREIELHGRMQEAVGAHFTVAFEGPEEAGLAADAIASLDRAYWRIGDVLGVYPVTVPVVLYTREQFRDITRSPEWAAGSYDGTFRVPMRGALGRQAELDRVLAHEFAHAVVRSLAPRGVPTWLNEGLATALENEELGWAESRVQRAGRTPLDQLQNGFGRFTGDQAQLAYATSALAVRRLIQDAGGFAIANLLRDVGDGVAFDTAFLHRIQRTFSEFRAGF